jgi:hypothetical protein
MAERLDRGEVRRWMAQSMRRRGCLVVGVLGWGQRAPRLFGMATERANEAFGLESSEVKVAKTLDEVLQRLKREPREPVRATVEGMTVEVRVIPGPSAIRSAADAFASIGPWEGETTEEMLKFLAEARRHGEFAASTSRA